MPERAEEYELVEEGHPVFKKTNKNLREKFWDAVIYANVPKSKALTCNKELRAVDGFQFYKQNGDKSRNLEVGVQHRGAQLRGDEVDFGPIRTDYGYRYDFVGESYINMPSCVPKLHWWKDKKLPTYTGFPIFLTVTTLVQVIMFIFFYTGDRCPTPCSTNRYSISQSIIALKSYRVIDNFWDYDWWRLWSYQFAHAGVGHLIPNVLLQIVFGTVLEILHGPLRVGTLYTLGVLMGGCFHLITTHSDLVGASAGVYSLITAVLANTVLNWSELDLLNKTLRLVLAGGYVIADILTIFFSEDLGSVSLVAHCGGALVGALLGLVLLKNFYVTKGEVRCQFISFFLFMLLVLITCFLMILNYTKTFVAL